MTERLTRSGFDYCAEYCVSSADCGFFKREIPTPCEDAAIYNRLAAYEDTGLEPEQIKNWMLTQDLIDSGITPAIIGTPLKHLFELAKAEREGRLLVLPCKVGDTVWQIVRRQVDISGYRMEWKWVTTIAAVKFRIWMTDAVGKTVFLTREEAEKKSKEKIPE